MDTPPPTPSPVVPPPPSAAERQDPSWWRHGCIPYIVLILAAVGLDFAWPSEELRYSGGIGMGIGCALWCFAILLLRKDFSKPEMCFMAVLALISFISLLVSGSLLNGALAFVLPIVLLFLFPQSRERDTIRYRTWWSYWIARRKPASQGRLAWMRQILPTLITVFVGVALFIVFLSIFASGNLVVQMVWDAICKWWNALVEWLELDWDFVCHAFTWLFAFFFFGFYTLPRPCEWRPLPPVPAEAEKPGRSLLPFLPLASLIGVNLAFLIATGTDIAYLWFGRAPEGVSQTSYLHDGAVSITWAAVLASILLVFLFRRKGAARREPVTRVAGYLLLLQCFLLAVSVYMRLFHQVVDYGFTPRRLQAAEALLLGLDGLVILVGYMACSGSFWKYTRICLGSMLLLLVSFGICPPAELAADLNLRYAPSHPHWKFSAVDFKPGCFSVWDNLAFALYVKEHLPAENENFTNRVKDAAAELESRVKATEGSWLYWNLSSARDIAAAEKILGRELAR